jgi:AspT/YidE/YbjL antiporter-like protein
MWLVGRLAADFKTIADFHIPQGKWRGDVRDKPLTLSAGIHPGEYFPSLPPPTRAMVPSILANDVQGVAPDRCPAANFARSFGDFTMDFIRHLFIGQPLVLLFVTIALGYLVGKLRVGTFVLGGIAGTLLVGVVIGQLGISIDLGIGTIFFALFIYAVGFQGGPQFFHALNIRSLNQLVSAFTMCFMGLLCVLAAAWMFGLDRGMAAGLAAGGLTQSAILGTAGDAIAKLGLSADLTKTMQTNVAVGYAVCYIFGSLGPIIMVTWFLPMVMRWDIRKEAVELAKSLTGRAELEPGQFDAVNDIITRVYQVTRDRKAIGQTTLELDRPAILRCRCRRYLPRGQIDRLQRQHRHPTRRCRRDDRHTRRGGGVLRLTRR